MNIIDGEPNPGIAAIMDLLIAILIRLGLYKESELSPEDRKRIYDLLKAKGFTIPDDEDPARQET